MICTKSELAIFKQLIAAQKEFDIIAKNKIAKESTTTAGKKFGGYAWADLAQVLDAITPALNNNNLFLSQYPKIENGQFTLDTFVANDSGEYLQLGSIAYKVDGLNPQEVGKVITYMRRYSILCAFGLATEDDDALSVTQKSKTNQAITPVAKGNNALLNEINKQDIEILKQLTDLLEIKRANLDATLLASFDDVIMSNDIVRAKKAFEYLKSI